MEKKLPIYECKVAEEDDTGIFAISFVESPAVERNFIALASQKAVKLALDRQKQVLTGVVLVPDQPIYRRDAKAGEYYIRFSAADIERIAQKMMRTGVALHSTTHQHERPLEGNYLTELWTVKDPKRDKAAALGLGELPAGTLVASYKVEDADYWKNEVMTGHVKGFSLEGLFNTNIVNMKKTTKTAAQLGKDAGVRKPKNKVSAFLKSVAAMLEGETAEEADAVAEEAKKDETDSGEPFLIFDLADGGEVRVDSEGFATLDGEQMAPGEHALADGNFIVIDDSGMLVVTQPEADTEEKEEAVAELARQRAKQFLAKMKEAQKPKKDREIAELKKRIAELEKQPSAGKAEPRTEGGAKDLSKMTHTEKMAAVLASRRARMEARRK